MNERPVRGWSWGSLATVLVASGSLLSACKSSPESTSASGATAPTAVVSVQAASNGAPASTAGATTTAMNAPTTGSTNEFGVTGADIQKLLSGQDGVDLETVIKDGKPATMRVFGVRPGSVAARLGAQNGDQIESINDVAVGTPGAMNQWTQMAMSDGKLTLKGQRAGKPWVTVLRIEGR